MDPTVQVALVGIVSTIVSTIGVVVIAIINKQSPTAIKHEDPPDEHDELETLQALMRKDQTIDQLKATNQDLMSENAELRAHRENCLRNHHGQD